ncbi:hypothetical protein LCGC14_0754310 [marine sediment metagenome]|uniref:Sulfotransferase domain-containing protein n=1 Tax=marine sediment metagenome TaxID=412755 RepID=A0A0F9SN75_9ZZZZ
MLIVAGIARSGLSLTMQILHAGGYPCEGEPPAFEPHLGGIPWERCGDRAVKHVDTQLNLPPGGPYDVIRLRRNLQQQARSFTKWAAALFRGRAIPISRIIASFRRDYAVIDDWAVNHRLLVLDFENLITDPKGSAFAIRNWTGKDLDVDRMAACVVKRSPNCYPGLLELSLIEAADRLREVRD